MKALADKVSSQAEVIAGSENMVAETRTQIAEFGQARAAIRSDLESLHRSREEVEQVGKLARE